MEPREDYLPRNVLNFDSETAFETVTMAKDFIVATIDTIATAVASLESAVATVRTVVVAVACSHRDDCCINCDVGNGHSTQRLQKLLVSLLVSF